MIVNVKKFIIYIMTGELRPELGGSQLVDPRETLIITEGRFFEPYKAELHELFVALGREHLWSDDPRQLIGYIRTGWIGAEHGNNESKDQFTDEQIAAAMPIFAKLRLSQETMPPDNTHYDDVIIVGGTTQANYRRTKVFHDAKKKGVTASRMTAWVGQRPKEARDGTLEELLSTEGRFAGHDITSNPWVQEQLKLEWEADPQNPWTAQFATETDLGRVATMKLSQNGADLHPYRIDLEVTDLQDPHSQLPPKLSYTEKGMEIDVPARLITDYRFTDGDGQEVVIMNAAAVNRGTSPSRHTTRSCTSEWLARHTPPSNARVLFISSNPHTLRTAQDAYAVLEESGRGDIQFHVAGASAPGNATVQLFLGEVGRLIDNDVKRNYAPVQSTETSSLTARLGEWLTEGVQQGRADIAELRLDVQQGAPRLRAALGALVTGVAALPDVRRARQDILEGVSRGAAFIQTLAGRVQQRVDKMRSTDSADA